MSHKCKTQDSSGMCRMIVKGKNYTDHGNKSRKYISHGSDNCCHIFKKKK